MKITTKGQLTIPVEFREKLGLLPHTEVSFKETSRGLLIQRKETEKGRGDLIVEHMKKFAGRKKMTTDEIMKLTRGE